MSIPYSFVTQGDQRFVKISDPPQLMDRNELWKWMVELRDDCPDLYAELVHVYILLTKPAPVR